jgi:hypothetical protein
MKLPLTLVLAIAASTIAITSASATVFHFSFAGPGVAASGTITSTGDTATSISGLHNGETITGPLPPNTYGGNQNDVFPTAPYLDLFGLGFGAGGIDYNVYYLAVYNSYFECNSATDPSCDFGGTGVALTSFTLAAAEPSTIALFAAGLAGTALRRRRREKS